MLIPAIPRYDTMDGSFVTDRFQNYEDDKVCDPCAICKARQDKARSGPKFFHTRSLLKLTGRSTVRY